MKFRTALCIGFLGMATLACGGSTTSSGDLSAYSVPLSDPWTGMNLPIDSGSVLYSDASTCTITYQGGTVADLSGKYEAAVKNGGWTESFKSTEGGMNAISYTKDGGQLTLNVVEAMGTATVSLTKF